MIIGFHNPLTFSVIVNSYRSFRYNNCFKSNEKEKQARKEETKKARQKLSEFAEQVEQTSTDIKVKGERHNARRNTPTNAPEKARNTDVSNKSGASGTSAKASAITKGAYVKIVGQDTVGQVESISGKNATCIFGQIRTIVKVAKLELAEKPKEKTISNLSGAALTPAMRRMREEIDNKRNMFHPELDIRGMRGEDALNTLVHYMDDALMIGMPTVRILHGKGDGILRHLVRQYLSSLRSIKSYRDENIQFGGTGITVVEI